MREIFKQLVALLGSYLLNIGWNLLDEQGRTSYLTKLTKLFVRKETVLLKEAVRKIHSLITTNTKQADKIRRLQEQVKQLQNRIDVYELEHLINLPHV